MRELVKWPDVISVARRWKSDPACFYEYTYDDGAFNRLVLTDLAESWDDFLQWSSSLESWGFRGQRNSSWTLQSSLEREIKVVTSYDNVSGHHHLDREMVGEKLINGFRALAPLYLQGLPPSDDQAGWLALMQHYGGPTRLLDWTECPFVGMYFTLRKESDGGDRSALWAIDLRWLERKAQEILAIEGSTLPARGLSRITYLNVLLGQSNKPLVVRIDPQHANERMIAQKGFFLWKLYRDTPLFDQMLMDMVLNPEIVQSPVIRKLEISPELRNDFLEKLRNKNVHEVLLFPGRDFCEPLKLELRAMVEREKAEYEEELRSVQLARVAG